MFFGRPSFPFTRRPQQVGSVPGAQMTAEPQRQMAPVDLLMGGEGGQKDRGEHRAGLRDAPWSEFPGAVMTGLSILGGGLPAMATAGAKIGGFNSPIEMAMHGLGWGGNQPSIAEIMAANTSTNPDSTRSASDPDGIGIGGPSASPGGYEGNAGVEGQQGFLNTGGRVTRDRLIGPDPPGPDDGFAALQVGEVVLNKEQQKQVGRKRIAEALARNLLGRR